MIAALALTASAAALGQAGLADPTRPPPGAVDADPGAPARAEPRLQSVLISNTRRLAVIDGRTVPIGGVIDGATLTSITETGVTLRRGGEVEMLKLHPGVEKRKGGPQ